MNFQRIASILGQLKPNTQYQAAEFMGATVMELGNISPDQKHQSVKIRDVNGETRSVTINNGKYGFPTFQQVGQMCNFLMQPYQGRNGLAFSGFYSGVAKQAPTPPPPQNYAPKPPESLGAAMPPQYQPAPRPQPPRFPDPEVLKMAQEEVKAKQEAENKERYAEQERQKNRSISASYVPEYVDKGKLVVHSVDDMLAIADKIRVYITSGLWKGAEVEPDTNGEPYEDLNHGQDDIPF